MILSSKAGKAEQAMPDEEVLNLAIREQGILLILKRKHFIRLHTAKPDQYGIVVCTFDPNFEALAQRIHASIEISGGLPGHLIRVNRPIDEQR
jgi:hypothetical protein